MTSKIKSKYWRTRYIMYISALSENFTARLVWIKEINCGYYYYNSLCIYIYIYRTRQNYVCAKTNNMKIHKHCKKCCTWHFKNEKAKRHLHNGAVSPNSHQLINVYICSSHLCSSLRFICKIIHTQNLYLKIKIHYWKFKSLNNHKKFIFYLTYMCIYINYLAITYKPETKFYDNFFSPECLYFI